MLNHKGRSLNTLLHDVLLLETSAPDVLVTGLSIDTRTLKPGDIFCAYGGDAIDGRLFIDEAIEKGASAVLCDSTEDVTGLSYRQDIPVYQVKHLIKQLGSLASCYFSHPSREMTVVGFTGTNGKTTSSVLLASALDYLHKKCLVMGTLGNGFLDNLQTTVNTTSDPITVQAYLHDTRSLGVEYVSMEVSSHALIQDRVTGVNFAIAVFSNLTQDHLDYHKTMEAYFEAKSRLFLDPLVPQAILNLDSPFGVNLLKKLTGKTNVIAYSLEQSVSTGIDVPQVYIKDAVFSGQGCKATVVTPKGEGELCTSLIGEFNLSNVLSVLCVLLSLDFPLEDALQALSHVSGIPGRMETYHASDQPLAIVDYAHTPDAFEQVFSTVKPLISGRLIVVFGCGGDRDVGKRPKMARIAAQYCDHVFVTDDNVRFEDPGKIFKDVQAGFKSLQSVTMEHDRALAIEKAVAMAGAGDCVLLLGKGRETYQHVQGEELPFSEIECLKKQWEK